MLSPMKNIDCCGFNWKRGSEFCSGWCGEYRCLLSQLISPNIWQHGCLYTHVYWLTAEHLRNVDQCVLWCSQVSFKWCVIGCVQRRGAGVRGQTSVSPVAILSGVAPVLSPATFLSGEWSVPQTFPVFCMYNRTNEPK